MTAVLLATSLTACHRRALATVRPASEGVVDEHCWWSVNRSLLPPDSVAARFQRAYAALGLIPSTSSSLADTAWAQAGPTRLTSGLPGTRYAMWMVAYRRGDSTRYRYFVRTTRATITDTTADSSGGQSIIPLCTAVARAAAIPGVQPPQPTGEEALPVWRWRP